MGERDSLGEYIAERMSAAGIRRPVDLAEKTGLSKSYVSALLNGKVALPRPDKRRDLAAALGVRHIDLLIAAGELSTDEVPVEGATREPFAEGDPRREILDELQRTPLIHERAWVLLRLLKNYAELDEQQQ